MLITLLAVLFPFPEDGVSDEAVIRLLGLASVEEAGEEVLLELRRLQEHPLAINAVSADELQQCVLFTSYQAAALSDYMVHTGELLSVLELGMVDGFSAETALLYAPFLDFSPSGTSSRKSSHLLHIRSGGISPLDRWHPSIRTSIRYSANLRKGCAVRTGGAYPSSGRLPADLTASFSWESRRLKIYAGDLHLRFGQGLALWTGLSFTSLPSTGLLMKNPKGISVPDSYSSLSSVSGAGIEVISGHFHFSAAAGISGWKQGRSGFLPVAGVVWYGRRMRAGHTLSFRLPDLKTDSDTHELVSSFDISACVKGTDLFCELAMDWINSSPAVLAGFNLPFHECFRLAWCGRYYPAAYRAPSAGALCSIPDCADEAGTSLMLDFRSTDRKHSVYFSSDSAFHPHALKKIVAGDSQFRASLGYVADCGKGWEFLARYALKLRYNVRGLHSSYSEFRPKNDLRLDCRYEGLLWQVAARIHCQYSHAFSFLSYGEGGIRTGKMDFWLRQGFFIADRWPDRIYAYERDLPMSFSVPAYYGRGLWTGIYGVFDLTGWCRLYLKASYIAWPWNEKKKPGKAGLKCMLSFKF